MYEQYYGLTEPPFSLTPDPKYFYRSEAHNRAFELLQYGIQRREGFMILYGDIGTGKTTLCRAVLDAIDKNTCTALLLNPFLSETDLIKAILQDFGISSKKMPASASKQDLINTLNAFLLSTLEQGGHAVVLIDEAQNIPLPTLEQIRILSNLETNKEKLLQIVLVGQLNLIDVLSRPELKQLFQRVSIKCELSPLSRDEVGDYVRHRLSVAGGVGGRVSFSSEGITELYEYSGGVPRLINLLADRSLLAGMALNSNKIERQAVQEAAKTLQITKPSSLKKVLTPSATQSDSLKRAAVVLGLSILLAVVFVALWNGFRGTP
jgi:general secretion pathway protein A